MGTLTQGDDGRDQNLAHSLFMKSCGKNHFNPVLLKLKHGFDPVWLTLSRLKKCYLEKKKTHLTTSMQVGCSSQWKGRNSPNFKEPGHMFDVVSRPAPTRLWPSLNNECIWISRNDKRDPGARLAMLVECVVLLKTIKLTIQDYKSQGGQWQT